MARTFPGTVSVGAAVLAVVVSLGRPALAADDPRASIRIETAEGAKIELETGADWVKGLLASVDVECEADRDRETRKMMASLTRQGEGGVFRGVDDDGDFTARRRDGMLRIEKAGEGGERTLVEMPWEVARCLIAGVEPQGDLGARIARGDAKLRFETVGDGGKVSIRLE